MELAKFLNELLNDGLQEAILSNPIDRADMEKVKMRRVFIKGQEMWQTTVYRDKKVLHSNHDAEEIKEKLLAFIGASFKQAQIESVHYSGVVLVGKRGTMTMKKKQKKQEENISHNKTETGLNQPTPHNRVKNYIIKEGEPVDFLVELGVMTKDGHVVKQRYDKFRQINRFLEFIQDVLPELPKDRTLRIVDFGCGKSYLTFAMYFFLHEMKSLDVQIVGLDLKTDVIERCSKLAEKLNYSGLKFQMGDIAGYKDDAGADMVVTLHACDTATDYALAQAVEWKASVILSVPCCQHEVNRQIHCDELAPILKYGILKERMSALITDGLRAELLKEQGYDTQILEFIDMEHTPKNLLIRAVRRKGMQPPRGGKSTQVADYLHLDTTLQKLLRK